MRPEIKTFLLPLLLAVAAFVSFSQETESDALAEDPRGYFDRRTLLAITNQDYAVTPGDVYTLTYNRDLATVTQYLIVEADFKVNLSLFGIEDVKSLTFLELKKLVENKVLTAYPKSLPHVTIRSTGIFEVFIKGEVQSAGFKLAWGLTRLSEIVSDNLTPYSSIRNIQVTSTSGRTRYYDLFHASRFGSKDQDPFVRPGDTVTVSKNDREIVVSGEVERPGTYQLLRGEQMEALIVNYCGGFTRAADRTRVELYQYNSTAKVEEIKYLDLTKGFGTSIYLWNGDAIVVPSQIELLPIVYFQGALVTETSNPQERFVIYRQKNRIRKGETLYTALRSVELSPQADLAACYIIRNGEKIFLDLDDYLYNYDPENDFVLQPLDTIIIPYIR